MYHQDEDKDDNWMLLQGRPLFTSFGDSDKISDFEFKSNHEQPHTQEYRHQLNSDCFVSEDNTVEFSTVLKKCHDIKGATKELCCVLVNLMLNLKNDVVIYTRLNRLVHQYQLFIDTIHNNR